MFNSLTLGAGALVGAVAAFLVLNAYNTIIENPRVEKAAYDKAMIEASRKTEETINGISDTAERARAMRRHCIDNGLQYNSATGQCR